MDARYLFVDNLLQVDHDLQVTPWRQTRINETYVLRRNIFYHIYQKGNIDEHGNDRRMSLGSRLAEGKIYSIKIIGYWNMLPGI